MDYSPFVPSEINGPQSVSATGTEPLELGRTPPRRERADAARNRKRVLAAAADLFRRQGVANVSLDAVAAAAGVGKGTVFRRFGDKSGLAAALLDEAERDLQDRIITGPPPLGPGADPARRLHAFADAYLDYLLDHLDLVRMSETAAAGARYRIGAYGFWQRHLALLLAGGREGTDAFDAEAVAHAVLAPLAAEHVTALLPRLGPQRLRRAIHTVIDGLTDR
jgi:AcrR family transcriptional regulator